MQFRHGGNLGRVTAGLLLLAVAGCTDMAGSTRQAGELRDMNAVAAVGAARHDAVEELDLATGGAR